MQPRSWFVALFLACALALPAASFGAGGVVVPGGNTGKGYGNNNMPKNEGPKYQTFRFVAAKETMVSGQKRTAVLLTKLNGSGQVQTVIGAKDPKSPKDQNPEIEATVDKLQKGDVVQATLGSWNGMTTIQALKKIEVKPAEENPHGFVFQEFYNEPGSGAPVVRLTKFGESYEVTFPTVKGDKGKLDFDPAMVDAVQKFKTGEALYVQLEPGRGMPVAMEMFPYKDPQTGKVTKASEEEVDGGKTPALDIESSDGKTVTALVPGKVNGKRFVPDSHLAQAARGMKPGTDVVFLTRDDNGKNYLVEIAKAPKTAASATPKGGAADNMTGGDAKTAKGK